MQFLTVLSLAIAAVSAAPLNIIDINDATSTDIYPYSNQTDFEKHDADHNPANGTHAKLIPIFEIRSNNTADVTSLTVVGETTNANASVFVVPESFKSDILDLIKTKNLNSTTFEGHNKHEFTKLEFSIARIASNSTRHLKAFSQLGHNDTHTGHDGPHHEHNETSDDMQALERAVNQTSLINE